MAGEGSEFKLRVICEELADVSEWYTLGVKLDLPSRILSKIECDYSRVTRRIQEVVGAWLRYDLSASWSKLADSVDAMDHRDIAERIRSKYTTGHNGHSQASTGMGTGGGSDAGSGAGDTPDLIQLLKFPGKTKRESFSIATEIGVKYKQFGIFLLNDSKGAKVDSIALKHNNDSEQINIEILQLWLAGQGRDVSWGTLIDVLNTIGLRQLAIDIASVKRQ